jgi:DNA-binding NarL/FixJ family response regulator
MADSGTKPSLPPPLASEARTVVVEGQPFLVISHPAPSYVTPSEPSLTSSEREVLLALVSGEATRAIARVRRVAVRTVENQIASIYAKLGVRSRSELVAFLSSPPRVGR